MKDEGPLLSDVELFKTGREFLFFATRGRSRRDKFCSIALMFRLTIA